MPDEDVGVTQASPPRLARSVARSSFDGLTSPRVTKDVAPKDWKLGLEAVDTPEDAKDVAACFSASAASWTLSLAGEPSGTRAAEKLWLPDSRDPPGRLWDSFLLGVGELMLPELEPPGLPGSIALPIKLGTGTAWLLRAAA
eukprot:3056987-Prymnesium_polylepis.1